MKILLAHPITSYFDATSQLLKAQGEEFDLIGATTLNELDDLWTQQGCDVYVIDSVMLRHEPESSLEQIGRLAQTHPVIVMIEETEEEIGRRLKENGPVTLLYKRKGYLTALAEGIRQSHADHLRRIEAEARAEAQRRAEEEAARLRAEAERLQAEREEAARLEAKRAEEARIEAERLRKEQAEAASLQQEREEADRRQAEQEAAARAEAGSQANERDSTRRAAAAETGTGATPEGGQASADEGFFICDRRGRFLSANKNLQAMLNYSEDEILELSLADLLSKEEEQTLFEGVFSSKAEQERFPIVLHFIDKVGERHPVQLKIRMLRDESQEKRIIGFRGSVTALVQERLETQLPAAEINQGLMVHHLLDLVQISYTEPLNVLLKRTGEIVCQIFGFQRATVALLDRRRKAYIKQAMIGYGETNVPSGDHRPAEVPQEVIDRLFADRLAVKVIYYSQESLSSGSALAPQTSGLQPMLLPYETQWHPRDLVLLRLADHRGSQFGYISVDEPLADLTPTRTTFYNLELFSQLIAMVIENYYRFSTIDKRNRRLKQILINSNIFKLYLSLNELLKEVVWAVKFSLEFNLVSLILISKKSGLLETKAVACDDRIKLGQISELTYDLKDFSALLREEFRRGKSYLISNEEKVLQHFKQIYYGSPSNGHYIDGWPRYALLLVPIKSREGKIIGFVLADDPADGKLPTTDCVHILEILANQVAIAIDNRMLYVQAKEKAPVAAAEPDSEPEPEVPTPEEYPDENSSGLRKLVDRFLR